MSPIHFIFAKLVSINKGSEILALSFINIKLPAPLFIFKLLRFSSDRSISDRVEKKLFKLKIPSAVINTELGISCSNLRSLTRKDNLP